MAVESGITAPVTGMTKPDNNNSKDLSFISSSLPVSDTEIDRHPRAKRPYLASRRPSASILVPRDHPEIEIQEEEFPPDDARAMSPRRNPADVERLCREIQEAIQQVDNRRRADTFQSSLQALAEHIDEVKSEHDKLENESRFLQGYIGDLARAMSLTARVRKTDGKKPAAGTDHGAVEVEQPAAPHPGAHPETGFLQQTPWVQRKHKGTVQRELHKKITRYKANEGATQDYRRPDIL
ncbi:predicted protein [Histoplasma mississippiense (nom. inval.)]|uniref:predicted protein n=1 Tax=Ajellomyces capsulatus (strain NAm1 / WU24) TaxID=2059318 RepID=UPI000157B6EE|nr:predicted protein [Histoplasma mississippiense (nom. inval.)]EDN03643.1 predicted protein [Histoplasma mississippiense (nom. inval.)]